MTQYSHSKLSTFEQCSLKYKFKYIDKIKPKIERSIEAHLGSSVHETLEWLYIQVNKGIIPTIEKLIEYYTDRWAENYKPELLIVKKQFTATDYFNKGVGFIVDYFVKNQPFNENTLATEQEVEIILDPEKEIKIIGYIDRIVDNKETNEIEIHDYKTANSLPSREKIENDRQLALYSIAIKEQFGKDKKVLLVWHYLAHNTRIHSRRTNEQLENLKKEILELIQEIKNTKDFFPNKSILCNWCEFKDICPEFSIQRTLNDF